MDITNFLWNLDSRAPSTLTSGLVQKEKKKFFVWKRNIDNIQGPAFFSFSGYFTRLKLLELLRWLTWFTQTIDAPCNLAICCNWAAIALSCLAFLTASFAPYSLLNKAAIESITISFTFPCDSNKGAFFVMQNCRSSWNNRERYLSASIFPTNPNCTIREPIYLFNCKKRHIHGSFYRNSGRNSQGSPFVYENRNAFSIEQCICRSAVWGGEGWTHMLRDTVMIAMISLCEQQGRWPTSSPRAPKLQHVGGEEGTATTMRTGGWLMWTAPLSAARLKVQLPQEVCFISVKAECLPQSYHVTTYYPSCHHIMSGSGRSRVRGRGPAQWQRQWGRHEHNSIRPSRLRRARRNHTRKKTEKASPSLRHAQWKCYPWNFFFAHPGPLSTSLRKCWPSASVFCWGKHLQYKRTVHLRTDTQTFPVVLKVWRTTCSFREKTARKCQFSVLSKPSRRWNGLRCELSTVQPIEREVKNYQRRIHAVALAVGRSNTTVSTTGSCHLHSPLRFQWCLCSKFHLYTQGNIGSFSAKMQIEKKKKKRNCGQETFYLSEKCPTSCILLLAFPLSIPQDIALLTSAKLKTQIFTRNKTLVQIKSGSLGSFSLRPHMKMKILAGNPFTCDRW